MPAGPYRVTISGSAGYSTAYLLDNTRSPQSYGIFCDITSTAAAPGFNLEYTFDPIAFPIYGSSVGTVVSSAATWIVSTAISTATTDTVTNFITPCVAIRLNVTANSSQGSVTMSVIPSG